MIDLVSDALEKQEEGAGAVEKEEGGEGEKEEQFEKDAAIKSEGKIGKEEFELMMTSGGLTLFMAGFDTSSTTLSVLLAYLCKHEKVQERLAREIREAVGKNRGEELDYGQIQGLPYLDMVIHETLRLYFSGFLERECVKDYKLPNSDFVVPKGMLVQVCSLGIHRDDRFYPDPLNFNPDENFSPESKANRSPYAFLGFGQGPRNCIGMRLALLMVKIAVVKILEDFDVEAGPKMPDEIEMDPRSRSGQPKGMVWCKVKPRKT